MVAPSDPGILRWVNGRYVFVPARRPTVGETCLLYPIDGRYLAVPLSRPGVADPVIIEPVGGRYVAVPFVTTAPPNAYSETGAAILAYIGSAPGYAYADTAEGTVTFAGTGGEAESGMWLPLRFFSREYYLSTVEYSPEMAQCDEMSQGVSYMASGTWSEYNSSIVMGFHFYNADERNIEISFDVEFNSTPYHWFVVYFGYDEVDGPRYEVGLFDFSESGRVTIPVTGKKYGYVEIATRHSAYNDASYDLTISGIAFALLADDYEDEYSAAWGAHPAEPGCG